MSTTLKKARQERQLTVAAVALAVGTDQGNLSRIENGKQMPGRKLAQKLYDFYGGNVSMVDILMPSSTERAA